MHSFKNYLIAILAVTTAAGAILAWNQYQELITLRAAAMDSTERASWQKRLWAAEKRRGELESEVASLNRKAAGGPKVADAPAAEGRGPRFNGRNNFMAMMERPEVQRLIALQQKAGLDSRYASLFKSLALTPAQLDQFKNLLVEKRTAMMDVMSAAREQGINPRSDPEEFQKLVGNAQSEIDANIQSTLGDAGYAQYQNYEKTLPERNVVSQLEQRLSYSTTPLTSEQSDQLLQILAATTPQRNSGTPGPLTQFGNGMAAAMGFGSNGARITDAAINQSLGVLAAPQIDALKQIQQEQQAQAELNATMRSRFQNNPAPSPGTTAPSTPATPVVKTGG